MSDEFDDDINKYSQPLGPGQPTFTVDWKYPAFHLIGPDPKKKPPLVTPLTLPWPGNINRNSHFFDPSGCVFKSFKCRVRSRINHNALMVVWVFAPNRDVALRYMREELNVRSPV